MRYVGALCALATLTSCFGAGGESTPHAPPWEQTASLEAAPALAGCGAPAVDGVLSPGEWDGAIPLRFTIEATQPDNSWVIVPAEVTARSDDRDLYVAFRLGIGASALESVFVRSVNLAIDTNESGAEDGGDDAVSFLWDDLGADGPASVEDSFLWDCYRWPLTQEPAICASPDTNGWIADLLNGTSDGVGAIHYGDTDTTIELSHPYVGSDPRDVLRVPGQPLPLRFGLTLSWANPDDPAGAYYGYRSTLPSSAYLPVLLEACTTPPPDPQVIEIRLGVSDAPLPASCATSDDSLSVALMGAAAFDAASVDPGKLFLAGASVARDGTSRPCASIDDVNGDGVPDLVAQFRYLYWSPGAAPMTLAGRTRDGRRFYGAGSRG